MEETNWTVETLKELLEARITGLDERITVQHKADELARELASENIDNRLQKLNELRDVVAANDSRYMPRETAEQRISSLESTVKSLLYAVGIVAAAVVTNLVKLWTG